MNHKHIVLLTLLLVAGLATGCEKDPVETDSERSRQSGGKTKASQDKTVELPVETKSPTKMVDAIDIDEEHRGKDRVILLFAQSPDNPEYREMAAELAESTAGLEERDVVVYHMFWERPGLVGERGIPADVAEKTRRKYAVLKDAFTFILIGKDTGQKMRSEEAVPVETVFEEIDNMPMRRREMKAKEDGGTPGEEGAPVDEKKPAEPSD